MILSYKLFLRNNPNRLKVTLMNLEKKCFPTSVTGLIRMGLDESIANQLQAWILREGLSERVVVSLFVGAYLEENGVHQYVGKAGLDAWIQRRSIEEELIRSVSRWTKGVLTSANTPVCDEVA